MYKQFPMMVILGALLSAPLTARSQTTDEARALARENLPAGEAPRPVPPGTIAQTTDDARALAGRVLPRSPETPRATIQAIGTTDEARKVAGGQLLIAPSPSHQVASCANVGTCPTRG